MAENTLVRPCQIILGQMSDGLEQCRPYMVVQAFCWERLAAVLAKADPNAAREGGHERVATVH